MTVTSQSNQVEYSTDGSSSVFQVPFYFLDETHLVVTLRDPATESGTVLLLGTDYTVSGAGDFSGGSIQTVAIQPAGLTIDISRSAPLTQETDYVENDPFPAQSHERALDKLTMITQQLSQGLSYSLTLDAFNFNWNALGKRITNVGDPVNPQDAATLAWAQSYIGGILSDFTGDINVASNVAYFGTDGVSLYSMQDLSNKVASDKGSALIGRSVVVVDSIKDLLNPALSGRTDIVVQVQRYWAGVVPNQGGGLFIWLDNPKSTHDGGVRISPTVPWDGTQASHAAFLSAAGETDPAGNGYWARASGQRTSNRSPVDYGAATVSIVPDCKYIFDQFEAKFPGALADLAGDQYRVSVFPSGAQYVNGTFRRISDGKVIDSGWSASNRVGNRNALVGRNTATNLTTNNHEQTGGQGYNLTALGDGALYSAGNNLKHQTAIGPNAGYNQQHGRYNIYIGLEAGYSCTGDAGDEDIGSRNVVVGDNGARFNQGDQNVAIGRNAMQVNTSGRQNVYIGSAAGGGIAPVSLDGVTIKSMFPTTGLLRTAVGTLALNWGIADNSTAYGAQALENLKGGASNCAIGNRALRLLESGYSPLGTAVSTTGAGAVTWTKSGTTLTISNPTHGNSVGNIIAVTFTSGVPANVVGVTQYLLVASVSPGASWTYTLTAAEAAAISASGNATVVECYRNTPQTTQDNNTALGNSAGQALLLGSENLFAGQAAAFNMTSATQCTALGRSALRLTQSGGNETGRINCTGVGYNASVSGNDQIQMGNSATTTYVYGTVQNRSDERDKADIAETELGIEFILGLEAIGFRWDMREDYIEVIEHEDGSTETIIHAKDGSKKRSRVHQGFRAQQVKALCESLGVDFGGLQHHAKNGGDDVFSLGYDEFIAPLTKAVQQCWARMDAIEARLDKLEG